MYAVSAYHIQAPAGKLYAVVSIFFVRAKDSPDIPLVTLEYSPRSHKVLQCYGEHGYKPSEDILHYVNKIWLPYANKTIKQIAA